LTVFFVAVATAMLLSVAFCASAFALPGDSEANATSLNDYLGSSITTDLVAPTGAGASTAYFFSILLSPGQTLRADFAPSADVINLKALDYYDYVASVALPSGVQRLTFTSPATSPQQYTVYVGASTSGTFTATPSIIQTVWRFRNLQNGYYLWSADSSEKATIISTLSRTWFYEGAAYTINTTNPLNSSLLWRFRNNRGGFYLYTADPNEKQNIINTLSGTWTYEGPAYNVSMNSSGAPVWRFRNLQNGTYLYSADPNEKNTIVATLGRTWFLEGVAYYLAP
jgi:hypothetical protein